MFWKMLRKCWTVCFQIFKRWKGVESRGYPYFHQKWHPADLPLFLTDLCFVTFSIRIYPFHGKWCSLHNWGYQIISHFEDCRLIAWWKFSSIHYYGMFPVNSLNMTKHCSIQNIIKARCHTSQRLEALRPSSTTTGHLHNDIILLLWPESFRVLLPWAN